MKERKYNVQNKITFPLTKEGLYDKMEAGEALRFYRQRRGYSLTELSILSAIPASTICRYETGSRDLTHASTQIIMALAHALEISPIDLLQGN